MEKFELGGADNSTRYITTMSHFGAWRMLRALRSDIEDLEKHPDADDPEYMKLVKDTLYTELQYLWQWFKANCQYSDWEDDFKELELLLYPGLRE